MGIYNGQALPRQGAVSNRGWHLLFYTVGEGFRRGFIFFCGWAATEKRATK
jgi:hypothetical protein